MKQALAIWTLAAAAVWAASAGAQQEYEIRLERPSRVGERYDVKASASRSQDSRVTANGQPQKPEERKLALELEGVVETVAVRENGKASQLKITVKNGTITDAGGKQERAPEGAVITATGTDQGTDFTSDKGELGPAAKAALELVFDLRNKSRAGEDAIFGAKGRKRVGDSWPIDKEAAAKDLAELGTFSKDDIDGKVTLAGVETVDGRPCLRINAHFELKKFTPTLKLPEGLRAEAGSVVSDVSGLFPVEVQEASPAQSVKSTSNFTLVGKVGPKQIDARIESATKDVRDVRSTKAK